MVAPLVFAGLPLLAAPVLYALRGRRWAASTVAAGLALVLAVLALRLPFDQPVGWLGGGQVASVATVMGRVLEVEAGDRLALAFMFAQAALLFLLSGVARRPGHFLATAAAILGLLAAALFIRPFVFAALFLELAAAAAVLMLVAEQRTGATSRAATRGALRYLVYTTLGLPFILLTGWLLEASAASPADPSFVNQATILLMFGFAVLLAIVPFHSWIPALTEHAPPIASAFVLSVMRLPLVFLLLAFLDSYPWLRGNLAVYRALTVGGGGMVVLGAVFAFGQRNFGRAAGYISMIDIGAVLLGVGLGTRAGLEAALITLVLRGQSLALWAIGLDQVRGVYGSDQFDDLCGAARRQPMAAVAAVVGLLSLAGFPLTAGFAGRWALLRLLAQIHPTAAILLLAGTASTALVAARGLSALLAPEPPRPQPTAAPTDVPEPSSRMAHGLFAVGFAVVLVLGFFPQWLLPAVANTASVFTRIGR